MSEGSEQQRYCGNCGAKVRAGIKFCVSCGATMPTDNAAESIPDAPRPKDPPQEEPPNEAEPPLREEGVRRSPRELHNEYDLHRRFFQEAHKGLGRFAEQLKNEAEQPHGRGTLNPNDLARPLLSAQRGLSKVEEYGETLTSLQGSGFHQRNAEFMLADLREDKRNVLISIRGFYKKLRMAEGYSWFKDEFVQWYAHNLQSYTQAEPKEREGLAGHAADVLGSLRNAVSLWREDFRTQFNRPPRESEGHNKEGLKEDSREWQNSGPQQRHRRVIGNEVVTSLAPAETLNQATEYMVGQAGNQNFTVTNKSENSVTFSNYRSPSLLVAAAFLIPAIIYLLAVPPLMFDYMGSGQTVTNENFSFVILLFLGVPMLIYLMVGGKHVYTTLTATPLPEGTRLAISGESAAGYEKLHQWVSFLPEAVPYSVRWEEFEDSEEPKSKPAGEIDTERPNTSDVPDQIRKLAELRDAGILSNEEFESKKSQLLDRM